MLYALYGIWLRIFMRGWSKTLKIVAYVFELRTYSACPFGGAVGWGTKVTHSRHMLSGNWEVPVGCVWNIGGHKMLFRSFSLYIQYTDKYESLFVKFLKFSKS